jgi:glycerol kinase
MDFPGQGILRVDGGASNNDLLMQVQAGLLGSEVVRPSCVETTALGAAYLAGLSTGFWKDVEALKHLPQAETRFSPDMSPHVREAALTDWRSAVRQARGWRRLAHD